VGGFGLESKIIVCIRTLWSVGIINRISLRRLLTWIRFTIRTILKSHSTLMT